MTYAIIADSGEQFRVEKGQSFCVDYRDVEKGSAISFEHVLAIGDDTGLRIGKPHVVGASVKAVVEGAEFGEKLVVQKFRRRKTTRRKNGHRQIHTRVLIQEIVG
ncbi:MAG TPA: 50S ribosomal protein L21 [Pirellulaceae bacterium]